MSEFLDLDPSNLEKEFGQFGTLEDAQQLPQTNDIWIIDYLDVYNLHNCKIITKCYYVKNLNEQVDDEVLQNLKELTYAISAILKQTP